MVLEEPSRFGELAEMEFSMVEFWIQIHNAPLCCMTKEASTFIGEQVGKITDYDEEEHGGNEGRFIRLRVIVDIRKPLKRFVKIDLTGKGDCRMLLVKYERLPDFCFHCGKLGHGERECTDKTQRKISSTKNYGPWLRASSPPKKLGFRLKKEGQNGSELELFNKGGRRGGEDGEKEKRQATTVRTLVSGMSNILAGRQNPESPKKKETERVQTEQVGTKTIEESFQTNEDQSLGEGQKGTLALSDEIGSSMLEETIENNLHISYRDTENTEVGSEHKGSKEIRPSKETRTADSLGDNMVQNEISQQQLKGNVVMKPTKGGNGLGGGKRWKKLARKAQKPSIGPPKNLLGFKRELEESNNTELGETKKQKGFFKEDQLINQGSAGLEISMACREQ